MIKGAFICLGQVRMSKTFKRVMQTALVFLLIVIFAVAALILLIDPNDYREQITAKASESLAQDLRINGEMSWSFWPSLALQLDQVELDNPDNFERRNMLSADEISVSLELAPLLSREFVIKRVDLRNADVTIVTRKDGISNLDHILTSSASAESSDEDGGIRSGPVRLEKVSITLLDEATDSSQLLDIDLAQLDYYAANENLPFSIDADVSDGGNQVLTGVVATGEVVIPSDNTPITVANLDLSAALSGLSDQFNLEGNVSIDTRNGLLVEMKNGTAQLW
jgi:AsmA protein